MGAKSSKVYIAASASPSDISEVVELFVNERINSIAHHGVAQVGGQNVAESPSQSAENAPLSVKVSNASVSRRSSENVSELSNTPAINSNVMSGEKTPSKGNLRQLKSLSSFACRQHLKQDNTYIPTEVVSASFLSKKSGGGTNNSGSNNKTLIGGKGAGVAGISGSGLSARKKTHSDSENSVLLGSIDEVRDNFQAQGQRGSGNISTGDNVTGSGIGTHGTGSGAIQGMHTQSSGGGGSKRPKLQDDADWIAVSDDEQDDETLDGSIGSRANSSRSMLAMMMYKITPPSPINAAGGLGMAGGFNVPALNLGNINAAAAANTGGGGVFPGGNAIDNSLRPPALMMAGGQSGTSGDAVDAHHQRLPHSDPHGAGRAGTLHSNQSYIFTQSGTMLLNGFTGAIGKTGIQSLSNSGSSSESPHVTGAAGGSNSCGKPFPHPKQPNQTSTSSSAPPTSAHASVSGLPLPMKERLVVLCKLGFGASSIVYKALDLSDMRIVALKIVPVFERSKRRQMTRELTTLFSMLRFIAKGTTVTPTIGNSSAATEANGRPESESAVIGKPAYDYIVNFLDAFSVLDEGGVALMMEYMDGGSLQDIVDGGGCDDEDTLSTIALQGLLGLKFLHDCNQIHRDLKPGNLLINKRGDVKVADLGILKQLDATAVGPAAAAKVATPAASIVVNEGAEGAELAKGRTETDDVASSTSAVAGPLESDAPNDAALGSSLPRTHTFIGTATYMSPERINGLEYSFPSDVWAFGLSMMALAIGKLPIDSKGGYWAMLQNIRDEASPSLPPNTVSCASDRLKGNGNDGNGSPGVFWSEEFRDFLACCLKKDPIERLTCAQLLQHPFVVQAHAILAANNDIHASNNDIYFDESGNQRHFVQNDSAVPQSEPGARAFSAAATPASGIPSAGSCLSSLAALDIASRRAYVTHLRRSLGELEAIMGAMHEHLIKVWREVVEEHKARVKSQEAESCENALKIVSPVEEEQSQVSPAEEFPDKSDVPTNVDLTDPPFVEGDIDPTAADRLLEDVAPAAPPMPRLFPGLKLQLEADSTESSSKSPRASAAAVPAASLPPASGPKAAVGSATSVSATVAQNSSSGNNQHPAQQPQSPLSVFDKAAVISKWHKWQLLKQKRNEPEDEEQDEEDPQPFAMEIIHVMRLLLLGRTTLSPAAPSNTSSGSVLVSASASGSRFGSTSPPPTILNSTTAAMRSSAAACMVLDSIEELQTKNSSPTKDVSRGRGRERESSTVSQQTDSSPTSGADSTMSSPMGVNGVGSPLLNEKESATKEGSAEPKACIATSPVPPPPEPTWVYSYGSSFIHPTVYARLPARPRVDRLARQLYLPVDAVVAKIDQFLSTMAADAAAAGDLIGAQETDAQDGEDQVGNADSAVGRRINTLKTKENFKVTPKAYHSGYSGKD